MVILQRTVILMCLASAVPAMAQPGPTLSTPVGRTFSNGNHCMGSTQRAWCGYANRLGYSTQFQNHNSTETNTEVAASEAGPSVIEEHPSAPIAEGTMPLDEPPPNTWVPVATTVNGSVWSIRYRDFAMIRQTASRRVWVQVDHVRDRTVAHRTTMRLINFLCGSLQSTAIETLRYDATGNVVGSYAAPYPTPAYVVPGSVLEGAFDIVCGSGL